MEIGKECRAKLLIPICRTAFVQCSQNRPVRVCKQSCHAAATLIRECIPYPASQMILRNWNCNNFPDRNCTGSNAAPFGKDANQSNTVCKIIDIVKKIIFFD